VPYVAYRSLSATLGSLTVPLVFITMQQSGYSIPACVLASSLVLFDNAHVAETRLILLDATLIFSVALSFYCYVRFSKERNAPFSYNWWKWLLSTGVALSCVISTKYVGTFTFATVGTAVLVDLWNLLDFKAGLTLKQFARHFVARAFSLIILPFMIFLFWFYVHFAILTNSGPGDNFMSPEFQETLGENILAKEARQINYYDTVTLKHKDTGILLHSHDARYPLRYDDGRISSQGQQVTGYTHRDSNNEWQILPVTDFPEDQREGHSVPAGSTIRLRHVVTNTYLLTHDVASPYYPTNQEFTTVNPELANGEKFNYTLFDLRMVSNKAGPLRTKMGVFKLIHVPTKVAMWTHTKKLPEWGFGQYEINGNKNVNEGSNNWYFDEITDLTDPERLKYTPKERKTLPFLKKYLELQSSMFAQNNALTKDHPYASQPLSWPFLVRGVSFWTKDKDRTQIYFTGNFIGWWLEISFIAVYLGILLADQLSRRRNIHALENSARNKLYNSLGFFFIGWATHYFPFFLMGRQKFLHHYLPAHLAAAYLTGGLFDFIFGEMDIAEKRKKLSQNKNWTYIIATIVVLTLLIACFLYFGPLTYGWPGLTVEQIRSRQLMDIELHFSK
jgi:dolichyl-phosphate-mannose-protein mannosyltransferase